MARFEDAIGLILRDEGGYVHDPFDKGGETRYGISKAAHPDVDVANLTREQAAEIYRQQYWLYNGINDQRVANIVFTLAVMRSPKSANKMLQMATTACGHVVVCDGRLGPITLSAANAIPSDDLVTVLKQEARDHFLKVVTDDPSQSRFYEGWIHRINAL